MIVPRSRLIFWTGAVLLPLSVLWPLGLLGAIPAAALAAGWILFAAVDAFRARGRLDGTRVRFPGVSRLSQDREGVVELELENTAGTALSLVLGLAFPPELVSPSEEMNFPLPAGKKRYRLSWPCTGRKRGRFFLENVHLETGSPLGMWSVRRTLPGRAEVRVYPNTLRERKNLSALFLNRKALGIHAQRQVGKGREFEQLRDYFPGDGFEDIHWKATAKRGRPITKVFQIERTQECYVILDASRLSAREFAEPAGAAGETAASQLDRSITAALVLALVAERQGDLFGLLAFDDQVRSFLRARNGKAHYGACREALYVLHPRMLNPDFGELVSFIRLRLRRRALLIFLTSLDDPVLAEQFVRHVELIAGHHLVLVNLIQPPGVATLVSDAAAADDEDIYRRLAGHLQWQELKALEKVLKRRGVGLALLDQAGLCPQVVSQYLNVKRRQLL